MVYLLIIQLLFLMACNPISPEVTSVLSLYDLKLFELVPGKHKTYCRWEESPLKNGQINWEYSPKTECYIPSSELNSNSSSGEIPMSQRCDIEIPSNQTELIHKIRVCTPMMSDKIVAVVISMKSVGTHSQAVTRGNEIMEKLANKSGGKLAILENEEPKTFFEAMGSRSISFIRGKDGDRITFRKQEGNYEIILENVNSISLTEESYRHHIKKKHESLQDEQSKKIDQMNI